jgi:hypothetical protein
VQELGSNALQFAAAARKATGFASDFIAVTAFITFSTGIAKFRFCPSFQNAVATPITLPFSSRTGEPLEPGDMGAVIWMSFASVLSAALIPSETVH